MRRSLWALALVLILCASVLTGCGSSTASTDSAAAIHGTTDKLNIVVTVFPAYDWTRNLLGDRAEEAELTLLLDSGVDLHSYQPTVDDMVRISTCDIFLYVGGESDRWVADALKEKVNPDMTVLNLLELLGENAKEEELVEGMEGGEEGEEAEGPEYDEHVWLSLKNARVLCEKISQALADKDPAGRDSYDKALADYDARLAALDEQYAGMVARSARSTVLFGDRFPFRYLTDDYGLAYYGAFAGCSAETEASFETVAFLAGKVDELGLPYVLTLEGTDHRLAQTIIDASAAKSAQILTLDSMQSITADKVAAGADYLALMEQNLAVFTQALN